MVSRDIDNRFSYHSPATEEKKNLHTSIRVNCALLAHTINDKVPEGREKSLAITKLEEVMFWANAAVARSE